ncbi:MAG TPA: PAS domain S-box protein [Gemmatimonadales bacterium]|nr:PAS domain S-box protein [Gemmatimonadales bacterium]
MAPEGERGRLPTGQQTVLADEQRLHEQILNSMVEGVSVSDENGFILYTNPAEDRMFGYDRGELIGQHVTVQNTYPPEENQRIVAEIIEQLKKKGAWVGDFSNRRKDGTAFTTHARISAIEIGGRNLLVCVQEDVTEERQIQEQLHQAQRLDAVGRLAGGIAHDLNNMLTAIIGYSEFLVRGMEEADLRRQDVEQIRHAAERSANLTGQLLAFARRELIQPRNLDLNGLVQQAEPILRVTVGEASELRLKLASDLPAVFADPGRVEQILMNLVLNARDAMPQGGRVTIATDSVELSAEEASRRAGAMTPGARYTRLTVSDNGTGMDRATLERIWEPFFTTKPAGRGTGLGLAMVYGAAKQSGGFTSAYSELDHGTVMRVYWPAAVPAASAPQTRAVAPRLGGTETILVVEDEPLVRAVTLMALRELGYRCIEAGTAGEAIRALENGARVDLVLTDVVLPDMNGGELGRRIGLLQAAPRVLYTSAFTEEDLMLRGLVEREAPFLPKPFTVDQLALSVRRVLE